MKTKYIKETFVTKVTRLMIAPRYKSMPGAFIDYNNIEFKNMSRIIFIIGMFLFLFMGAKGQNLEERNGLYYNGTELYTGVNITRYDNGQVKQEMQIKNGQKHGTAKIYFENGQLNEIRSYKKNEMHGKWVMYNEHGIKTSVAHYKNGQKHGRWTIWNDYGNLLYELQYKNGEKSGTWRSYNEKGELINERKYQ
jgi:antitoxin component YwqK of YwqJK toxin-antitoxin module